MNIGISGLGIYRPGVRAGFVPSDAAGLIVYAKRETGFWQDSGGTVAATADADPVRRWDDQSGGVQHLVAPADAMRPALKLAITNGRNVLRFDGSDDRFQRTLTASLTGNLTVGIVVHAASAPAAQAFPLDVGQAVGTRGLNLVMETTGQIGIDNGGGVTTPVLTAGSKADGVAHSLIVTRSATTYTVYVDGTSIGTSGGTAPTYAELFVGCRATADRHYSRDLGELVLYDNALDASNIANLAAYFRTFWGTP